MNLLANRNTSFDYESQNDLLFIIDSIDFLFIEIIVGFGEQFWSKNVNYRSCCGFKTKESKGNNI